MHLHKNFKNVTNLLFLIVLYWLRVRFTKQYFAYNFILFIYMKNILITYN